MTGLRVSDEVRAAVQDGSPVLALESTIFTHGLPRPRNLEVAQEAEQLV
ncbi:MAG: pseudouridine-5'-phosphate glycosidase, partial [Mycetocola sp.]